MMTPVVLAAVMAGAVASLLHAARSGERTLEFLSKAVASASFVILGVSRWTAGDPVDSWLVIGLLLCASGDMLLISERTFDLGLICFLTGHVAYVVAFAFAEPPAGWPVPAAVPIAAVGLLAVWWMWPHLGRRRLPVAAYTTAIAAMAWGAVSTSYLGALPWTVAIGALLFLLSDLGVARQRFIRPEFLNRALGLPAYYAAQFLIALSI
jgi:uncharacterized membrane protein YhhN